jgi:hypothetical protein
LYQYKISINLKPDYLLALQDDQLGQMMRLIKDGYNKKTEQDRWNYGLRLKQELEEFTQTFLPHMQEEEEVGHLSLYCVVVRFVLVGGGGGRGMALISVIVVKV